MDSQTVLQMCYELTFRSLDPRTRVGCYIMSSAGRYLVSGHNQFPLGIAALPERLSNREVKNELTVHAEMAALMEAAKRGISVDGSTLYLVATDDSKEVWGGPPCTRCAVHVIAAGIRRVVSPPFKNGESRWADSVARAEKLFREAGVIWEPTIFTPRDPR